MSTGVEMRKPIEFSTSGRTLPSAIGVLRWSSLALAILIFDLISLGGLVRNAGAGLACPDWPLCFGKVVPPMNMQIFLEWFHRLIAGAVSVFLLAISAFVFMKAELRRELGSYCAWAMGLIVVQIVLGGLTVIGLLSPKWVSSHLGVGIATYGVLLMLAIKAHDLGRVRAQSSSWAYRIAWSTTLLFFGQMLLGGLVSSNYAGLACPDFPTCNGAWVPPFEGQVKFQFMHRIGALLATIAVLATVVAGFRRPNLSRRASLAIGSLPVLLAIQIFLGVGSVLFSLPLPMSVAHLGTAAAMFGMLLVTTYEIRRS